MGLMPLHHEMGMGCRLHACSTQRALFLQVARSSPRAQRTPLYGLGFGPEVPGTLDYPGYLP